MKKVWTISVDDGYEGFSQPLCVFSSEEAANNYLKKRDWTYTHILTELILDKEPDIPSYSAPIGKSIFISDFPNLLQAYPKYYLTDLLLNIKTDEI